MSKLPELLIRPARQLFKFFHIPNSATFTAREYSDPLTPLATQRYEAQINLGPALTTCRSSAISTARSTSAKTPTAPAT